ncbi:MAG: efflux RND transporter periplasmic adaptor subunit, partial [Candidatus Dormibacteria bacterium]
LDGFVNAQIQPQVSGYLLKQDYKEGSFVKKGDVLFEIDPRPFQAALDQTKGQLAQAQAQEVKAAQDVARDRPLAEAKAIAQSQLDSDVQAQLADKAVVQSAQAQVEQAELNLGFTKVRSLINGIAGIATGQIGNLVGPTTLLTTVSQVNPIKAYFAIGESEYMRFAKQISAVAMGRLPREQTPLHLILSDGSTYPHPGTFFLADREVDPKTGTIRIAVTFPNPEGILRPGQFGRVRAVTDTLKGAVLVPQRAVTELQGTYQVAVVGSDNKVTIQPVRVGPRVGSLWVIQNGLKPGERIVAEGIQRVREGVPVIPKPYSGND